jgi:hypothetical protein
MRCHTELAVLASALVGLCSCSAPIAGVPVPNAPKITQPADPSEVCEPNDCQAPDKWFQNGKTPKVAGDDYPKVDDDECAFYKFAWQSFLYLTQPENAGGPPRFVLFDTPNDLFVTAGGQKLLVAAAPARNPNKRQVLSLSVRNSPHTSRNIQAKAVSQAGSQGVVVDRNNRSLYYGQHINADYVTFINSTLGLKNSDQIKNVDPNRGFPEGCLELKSSWRALTEDEKKPDKLKALSGSFFITEALVPTLTEDTDSAGNKTIHAHAELPRPETVALVGLHVVGTTPGHAEFVWASFEHVENSPTPSKATLGPDDPINNNKGFTFYRQGKTKKECNVNPVPDDTTTPAVPLAMLDASKQTLGPIVDIYREFNSGDDGVAPDQDVCNLNRSVRNKLATISDLSVWSNYQLIGAVWLKEPATDFQPGKHFPPTANFAGEKKLSNSTMETFTQHKNYNCFACHDTSEVQDNGKDLPGMKIRVSHIIRNAFIGLSQ